MRPRFIAKNCQNLPKKIQNIPKCQNIISKGQKLPYKLLQNHFKSGLNLSILNKELWIKSAPMWFGK